MSGCIFNETQTDQNGINLREFVFCALQAYYSILHKSFFSLCLAHTHSTNDRYVTFHYDVMPPHLLNKNLILSLRLVPLMSAAEQTEAFVWARLCLGICEHGVHNCDSGFRRLTSVENKRRWFCVSLCSRVPPELKLKSENLPKNNQADRGRGRLPGVSSLSTASAGIPPIRISLSFPQFPRRNRHVLACLDTKLYLIWSDLHPDIFTQFSQLQGGISHMSIVHTLYLCCRQASLKLVANEQIHTAMWNLDLCTKCFWLQWQC